MPENPYVRVTDRDTGHRRTIRESQVALGNYTVLKADAVNPLTGDPLPPELNATKPLSNHTDGQTAKNEKETD